MKLLQRKFAVPMSANLMALMNDAVGLGFSFQLMVLLVAGGLAYALIEQWGDVARFKYGYAKKPVDQVDATPAVEPKPSPVDPTR